MMVRANQDIRAYATGHGVKLWQVAQMLGINDGNLSRKLRQELNEEEKNKIMQLIDKSSEGASV